MSSRGHVSKFHLFPAFSVETLAETLARKLEERIDPFVPETILITNYAQRIWLQHFIAERHGICANLRFLSPEKFLNEFSSNPERSDAGTFDRDALTWRVFKTLCALHAPGANTPEHLRFRFREEREEDFILLAGTLADLFWHYQSFRPEMIAAWTHGKDPAEFPKENPEFLREYERQKHLWQALNLDEDAVPALRYLQMLDPDAAVAADALPQRIFVFAPTAIPRVHFEMLRKLSAHTEVLFFYHNLSSDLWTETQNEKTIIRDKIKAARRQGSDKSKQALLKRPQLDDESRWIESVPGNELLTSWGKAARMLAMRLIDDACDGLIDDMNNPHFDDEDAGAFNGDTPPTRDSLLHCLQADIRENREAPQSTADDISEDLKTATSLRIHAVHSPMREMEILRDDLRDLFAHDETLRPRDVLVMLPDVDAYAPFIHAVFDNSEFPFSLADSAGVERFSGISALLSLLKMAQGECRISEMLALLDAPPLRHRLRLNEDGVALLQKILKDSEARWGLDEATRAQRLELAKAASGASDDANFRRVFYNNSWAFAMRRCALGIMLGNDFSATPDASPLQFGNAPEILPAEKLPENAAELLGKFARILEVANTLHAHFVGEKKSIAAWCRFLKTDCADALLEFSEDESEEAELLANAIDSICRAGEIAGMTEADTCSLKTLVSLLENRTWKSEHGVGMLRGKITFCQLQPLRNIPAQAIYIAGMNNGTFPGSTRRASFDLIAQWRNKNKTDLYYWDRNSRDDDCLLLLEAVLAAKKYLRFSYIGRRATDNSVVPPCTPLAKFIDAAAKIAPKDTFCFCHPAQPEAIRNATASPIDTEEKAFFMRSAPVMLSDREREKFASLSLAQLGAFFAEPAKFICENRLALGSRWTEKSIPDNDPEEDRVKTKTFLHDCVEYFAAGDFDETKFSDTLRERICRTIRRERAGGRLSALTDPEEVAQSFKISTSLPTTLAKAVSDSGSPTLARARGFEGSRKLEFPIHLEEEFNAPKTACVTGNFPNVCRIANADAEAPLVFLEAVPAIYSAAWELKIQACVTAAFIQACFPKRRFTLAVFPAKSLEDGKFCVVHSNKLPPDFMADLLQRFFEGLTNPPLLFSNMAFPQAPKKDSGADENPAEKFADTFIKDVRGNPFLPDYNRPFRQLVFGENMEDYREKIESDTFDFAETIDVIAEILSAAAKSSTGTRKKSK